MKSQYQRAKENHPNGFCQPPCAKTHGNNAHYNAGCRCGECTQAHTDAYKKAIDALNTFHNKFGECEPECPIEKHGTWHHYKSGCRCNPCRERSRNRNR